MSIFKSEKNKINKYTWSEFIEYYNRLIDDEIITISNSKRYKYYGGKCCFSAVVNEDEFSKSTYLIVESGLYYKDSITDKILERKISNKFNYREFIKDDDTLKQLREILDNKIEFEISSPENDLEEDEE